MSSHGEDVEPKKRRRPPARTPRARENQLIGMAYDQAEALMLEGRAPAPVLLHFLNLPTTKRKLEEEKLRREVAYIDKKTEQVDQGERLQEMMEKATESMKIYKGDGNAEDYAQYD